MSILYESGKEMLDEEDIGTLVESARRDLLKGPRGEVVEEAGVGFREGL